MSKSFELDGQMKVINEIQTFDSGFTKREFVVEVEDGRFPQMICFECVKDKTSLTDGVSVGDNVKVTFDIRGREYNGRYFTNLNAWKLEKAGGGAGDAPSDDYPPSTMEEPPGGYEDSDDIPF